MPAKLSRYLANRCFRVQHALDCAPLAQIQLCVGQLPFSLLFSKLGDLSQPGLECARVQVLQPSRNVTG
jgi:hypothetical protein